MRWTKIYIDLDGTIAGENEWTGFWHNTKKLFTDLVWKPDPYLIFRILTSRPIMDRPIIKMVCGKWDIEPISFHTSPTFFYKFKGKEDVAQWKFNFLQRELNSPLTQQIVYIDNDPDILAAFPHMSGITCCNVKAWKEMRKDFEASS